MGPVNSSRAFHALLALLFAGALHKVYAAEKEVSFKTQDGWTIYGALSIPEHPTGTVPAVILLPSREHDRSAFGLYRFPGKYQYPGLVQVINGKGVATLSLD